MRPFGYLTPGDPAAAIAAVTTVLPTPVPVPETTRTRVTSRMSAAAG